MSRRPLICLLSMGLFAALSLSACGAAEEEVAGSLTSEQAADLNSRLATIEDDFENGRCDDAADEADEFLADVDDLPADAGVDTKNQLRAGANRLIENIGADCVEEDTGPTMTTSEPEQTVPDTTMSTTETVEPPPEEEPEEPVEPVDPAPTPPEDPGGSTGGNSGPGNQGGGNGGSGGGDDIGGGGVVAP